MSYDQFIEIVMLRDRVKSLEQERDGLKVALDRARELVNKPPSSRDIEDFEELRRILNGS